MTEQLRAALAASFSESWGGRTERAIFGELGPEEIVEATDAACRSGFGSPLVDTFLYSVSVGVVAGCRLVDGREVVLKAYQRRWSPALLAAVRRTQSHLHASGFPCPRPIEVELRIGQALVLAEEVLPDPGPSVPTPELLAASARGLARLVSRCRRLDEPELARHPMLARHDGLYPEPHSPLFDFQATAAGAEWIDDLCRRASAVREDDRSAPAIAHTDWSMRNVRLDASGPTAVYDWDSLAGCPESTAVAIAAVSWSKTGEGDDPTPTAAEIETYLDHYEAERGEPFTPVQRRASLAAAVASMAYTARCEHSIDPGEERWTTTRPRLRELASLLD